MICNKVLTLRISKLKKIDRLADMENTGKTDC